MKECFNCGGEAQHKHHVVPRCKGGNEDAVVWLCLPCHAKVHDKKTMTASYLTRIGFLKKFPEEKCFIFWEMIMGSSNEEIEAEAVNHVGKKANMKVWLRTRQRKLLNEYKTQDLLDAFEPILKLKENEVYTPEYVSSIWEEIKHEEGIKA